MNLNKYTNRQLLEAIYLLLCMQQVKIAEIENDEKQMAMNTIVNLIGDAIIIK